MSSSLGNRARLCTINQTLRCGTIIFLAYVILITQNLCFFAFVRLPQVPTAHFYDDLGLDSLDAIEICMDLDTEFGFEIPENEVDKILSVNQAVDFIASHHPPAK